MTSTSIADYDPLADDTEDDSPDPIEVWQANQPFEEMNRQMNPANQATAKQARIAQLRLEITSLEFTVANASEMLAGRRDELANLLSNRPSGETSRASLQPSTETPT
jgi:hypothetical protein